MKLKLVQPGNSPDAPISEKEDAIKDDRMEWEMLQRCDGHELIANCTTHVILAPSRQVITDFEAFEHHLGK